MVRNMRRLIAALLLGLGATMLTVPTAQADVPNCIARPAQRNQVDFHREVAGIVNYWRYCWPKRDGDPDHGFVRTVKTKFVYVLDHTPMCGWVDPFQGMRFRLYIWNPKTGVNHSSKDVFVPCVPGQKTNSVTISTALWPRYTYANGSVPRWRATVTLVWDSGIPDQHGSTGGKFPHP